MNKYSCVNSILLEQFLNSQQHYIALFKLKILGENVKKYFFKDLYKEFKKVVYKTNYSENDSHLVYL